MKKFLRLYLVFNFLVHGKNIKDRAIENPMYACSPLFKNCVEKCIDSYLPMYLRTYKNQIYFQKECNEKCTYSLDCSKYKDTIDKIK